MRKRTHSLFLGMPWWVWALCILLPGTEIFLHAFMPLLLPQEAAFTGFHIGDTPFFLTSMNIFVNCFDSPYATCQSPAGLASAQYFMLPHHWLYGAIGWTAHVLSVAPFLMLGFANALCGFLYLVSAYFLLRRLIPRHVSYAFLIFTLGGGAGGVLYLLSAVMGWVDATGFEAWFHRYARYELVEGPFIAPLLVMPRLYYTLPLALGCFSLNAGLRGLLPGRPYPLVVILPLLFFTTYLNARVGMLFFLVHLCFFYSIRNRAAAARLSYATACGVVTILTLLLVQFQFQYNPSGAANVDILLRRCAWMSSLLSLLCWHFFSVPFALRRRIQRLPLLGKAAVWAALGYLFVFFFLYLAYQVYWGNLWGGGETAAAVAMSDWALLGGLAGLAGFYFRRHGSISLCSHATQTMNGVVLWFLAFLAIAVSAWGQGALLRFMPERFLVLLGLPLAVLSAEGLARLRFRYPKCARMLFVSMLMCGVCSAAVATLCFQGPIGHAPGKSAFSWVHSESVDAALIPVIDAVPTGAVVLAPATLPPLLGDVIVHRRPGTRTLLGQPSLEFGGVDMLAMSKAIQQFYAEDTPMEMRRAFLQDWCVTHMLVFSESPLRSLLDEEKWAIPIVRNERAVLYAVAFAEGGE